jgi:hypothetical protein
MPFVKSIVLLLVVGLAATEALVHHGRSMHHNAIAVGRRSPQVMENQLSAPMRRRSLHKRCKVRPSAPAAPVDGPVGNVGNAPATEDAPKPTSTKAATPPSKPTKKPTKPVEEDPEPTKGSSNPPPGGFHAGINTGDATYYDVGLGACGWDNGDDEMVVAVSQLLYDKYPGYKGGNPNNNPVCGKKIIASLNGKSVEVKVVDRCVGCQQKDLDFSMAAFLKIGSVAHGREKGMTWQWA